MTENTPSKPSRDPVLDVLTTQFTVFKEARPLAIGIHKAILERMPDLTKEKVSKALRFHTGTTRYLKALSQAERRYDLDGNEAGEVTEEQREAATKLIKERFRKANEKRKAEEARQLAEAQARQRQEKLEMLAAKFSNR